MRPRPHNKISKNKNRSWWCTVVTQAFNLNQHPRGRGKEAGRQSQRKADLCEFKASLVIYEFFSRLCRKNLISNKQITKTNPGWGYRSAAIVLA